MWLSYSKYDTYLKCPRRYKYEIDRIEPPEKQSKYFALYGLLIEKFFKNYTNVILPQKININKDKIRQILETIWDSLLEKEYVKWNDPWVKQNPNEIFEEVYFDVLENISTFDFWDRVKSEVTYDIRLKKSNDVLNGRIDFVKKEENGIELLDGKGTKHLDRVNPDQLLFYSLLYFLHHKKLPKKLGFLFYRYKIIRYIDFNRDILIQFKNKLALFKKAIKIDKKFEPKVLLSKNCLWCPYKLICKDYLIKKEANAKKRDKMNMDYKGTIMEFGL